MPEMPESKDPTSGHEPKALVDTTPSTPRFPKPKILVVDLKDDTEALLKAGGYTVEVGSFGTPYKVPKDNSYRPVVAEFNIPNYAEQEIIIIDLLPADTLEQPPKENETVPGEYDHWAKCNYGVVDPRPVPMSIYRSAFDKILMHGGVFIVFADFHTYLEIIYARQTRNGLSPVRNKRYDNWSFLTPLHWSRFGTNFVEGSEISVPNQTHSLGKLLSRHLKGATFKCTLAPKQNIVDENQIYFENHHLKAWRVMATDKYGAPVAGVFVPHGEIKGWVFIFPQLANKSRFLVEFLRDVLTELAPELFPYAEGGQWIYRDTYQLPSVLEMREQIQRIEEEAAEKVKVIEERIRLEQERTAYLRNLLIETGDPLVKAVKKALETLGFKDVLDMDEEMVKQGDTGPKREDLRVVSEPVSLLIEVKGITGLPTDADSLQVQKYVIVRMREWSRTNVQGLEIINHQKGLPALDRENENPFRQDILVNAEDQQFGLMTTWDLYILTRNFLKNNWKPENVKGLFFQSGRIQLVPAHYEFVGTVEEVWGKASAVGVRIEAASLKQGDRIAFRFPTDFEEQEVTSLQVDDQSVSVAEVSTLVGIKTHLANQQIKKGIRIYRVTDSAH